MVWVEAGWITDSDWLLVSIKVVTFFFIFDAMLLRDSKIPDGNFINNNKAILQYVKYLVMKWCVFLFKKYW